MNSFGKIWKNHWKNLDDAGSRYMTEDWIAFYAKEISFFFPDGKFSALELGCGNGDLHKHHEKHFDFYTGVDFSLTMLSKFKERFPGSNIVCADATNPPYVSEHFDVIFSYGLCQYFNMEMLEENLVNSYRVLKPNGIYIIGSIPDLELKNHFVADALRSDKDASYLKLIKSKLYSIYRHLISKENEYLYHKRRTVALLSEKLGYQVQTYSSMSYEYRFNAVLRKI